MTTLITEPELVQTAAKSVTAIRSSISEATGAAAGPTTGVVAAAADEVSAAAAKLFGGYAQQYQAVLNHAAAFHDEFAAALAAAGHAYAGAEAASASALSHLIGGPIGPILGGPAPVVQPMLQGTTFGLIMGGSGLPIPPPEYVTAVLNYVNHGFNVLPQNANPLFTPEGYYPLILKSLPLTPSISQGLQILDSAIKTTLAANPGDSVAILGYSQSADISSLEMINLANPLLNPNPPSADQLSFTLLGNQMNPNGGFFARFPGFGGHPLQFPALGLTLYGATPSDTIYPTNIYTLEYDGWADFPRYPLNLLSDLNAELGIAFVHGQYPSLDPSALPPGYELVTLPTSPGYNGVTNYYMITTPNGLPLLEPLRLIPGIGNPLADLLQPDLTMLVNLGYGDPHYGYSTAPADVQTYFGLFPHYNKALLAQDLILGAHQGAVAFNSDIQTQTATSVANVSHQLAALGTTGGQQAALHSLSSAVAGLSPDSIIPAIQTAVTNAANGISNTAANLYGALLPTADIINTLVTVMPAYDINLFLSGIQQALGGDVLGGLQYALVAPFAADTALISLAALIELEVVLNAFGISL
ncbi:PE family protein [Mycobacterium conspicuum]|uniref:PE family protein PE1 n=1 Tax=Mycobacterium conspicuum TaxID=44010 RepID=A0A1X1TI93_9MYCO|nr:PE-PPE domain-containing protein [Mycobacterium conspicuum]ORV44304.1 PE family protein [Mycobacterium conspicuum]BBZ42617.1 PE family protein PE1 [Mycobacterium conspicuum]